MIQNFHELNEALYADKTLNLQSVKYKKWCAISKNLQQNNSETVTNEDDKEVPKESYISPENRKETIDDVRLIK